MKDLLILVSDGTKEVFVELFKDWFVFMFAVILLLVLFDIDNDVLLLIFEVFVVFVCKYLLFINLFFFINCSAWYRLSYYLFY